MYVLPKNSLLSLFGVSGTPCLFFKQQSLQALFFRVDVKAVLATPVANRREVCKGLPVTPPHLEHLVLMTTVFGSRPKEQDDTDECLFDKTVARMNTITASLSTAKYGLVQ